MVFNITPLVTQDRIAIPGPVFDINGKQVNCFEYLMNISHFCRSRGNMFPGARAPPYYFEQVGRRFSAATATKDILEYGIRAQIFPDSDKILKKDGIVICLRLATDIARYNWPKGDGISWWSDVEREDMIARYLEAMRDIAGTLHIDDRCALAATEDWVELVKRFEDVGIDGDIWAGVKGDLERTMLCFRPTCNKSK